MPHARPPVRRSPLTGALLGGALVAVLALTPGGAATAAPTGPAALRSPAADDPALADYAGQQIPWSPCFPAGVPAGLPPGSERLECGSFLTPRDWEAPGAGADLEIAVSRLRPTSGEAGGSVLTNPGGPGGPGLSLPLVYLATERTRLTESREVVGIDVRGTGASTNVTCAGATSTLDALDPRDRSEAATDLVLDTTELVADTCQGAAGDLSAVISTEQTVRDLDLLRALLGRESVDWVGYSGGTWLGAAYASAFPDRVGRFVLDANTWFTADWQESFALQPLGFQRRFEVDFLPWVARYPDRFGLGATPEEVLASYEQTRAALARAPVPLLPGVDLGPAQLDDLVASGMYGKTLFTPLADTLAGVRRAVASRVDVGGGAPAAPPTALPPAVAAEAVEGLRRGAQRPLAGDAADATFAHVTCNDTSWKGDRSTLLSGSQEQGEQYPLVGWDTISSPCVFWERPERATLAPRTGEGVPPVLMVQNDRDPATPLEGALAAREAFAGARLLLVTDEGDHTVYPGNPCVDERVEAFLLDGAPAEDAACPGVGLPEPTPPGGAAGGAGASSGAGGTPLDLARSYARAAGFDPR